MYLSPKIKTKCKKVLKIVMFNALMMSQEINGLQRLKSSQTCLLEQRINILFLFKLTNYTTHLNIALLISMAF